MTDEKKDRTKPVTRAHARPLPEDLIHEGREERQEAILEAIREVLTAQVDEMLQAAQRLREETAVFLAEGGFSA